MFSRDDVVTAAKEMLDADRNPGALDISAVASAAEDILKEEITSVSGGTINISDVVSDAQTILKTEITSSATAVTTVDIVTDAKKVLGDLGTTYSGSISAQNIAREIIGDTVSPYRWSAQSLTEYENAGKIEVQKMHPSLSTVGVEFNGALAHYIASLAFASDNDAQANNNALSKFHYEQFAAMASIAPEKWGNQLDSFATTGLEEVKKLHPELTTVPKMYQAALVNYVVAQGIMAINPKAGAATSLSYMDRFSAMAATGPYFWTSTGIQKLTSFANAGIAEIKKLHPELISSASVPACYKAALVNYVVAQGLEVSNIGSDDARSTKYMQLFMSMATTGPYFWTSNDVNSFVQDGIKEVKKLHPEIIGSTISEDYTTALINYAVYRGLAVSNIGNDDVRSSKYIQLFNDMATSAPYCWQGIDLTKLADDGAEMVISVRPDLRISDNGTIKTIRTGSGSSISYDLALAWRNTLAYYVASRAGILARHPETNAYYEKFREDIQSL